MKKIYLSLFALTLILTACNQDQIDQLNQANDQANQELAERDSVLNEMFGAFNEIQDNLNQIKERQGVMRLKSNDAQNAQDLKQNITDDLQAINELLEKNKELVDNLNKRLKASKMRIGELERLVANLNQELADKNQEIARLNALLEDNKLEMGMLYFMLDSLTFTNQMKDQELASKTQDINTAYYAYGTYKELKEKNVLTKEGGVLGLGKTETLKDDFNKDYFNKIDIRKQKSFLIYAEKAELITKHPKGSYEFKGEDKVDSLVITNPEKFWEASKYLVIVID